MTGRQRAYKVKASGARCCLQWGELVTRLDIVHGVSVCSLSAPSLKKDWYNSPQLVFCSPRPLPHLLENPQYIGVVRWGLWWWGQFPCGCKILYHFLPVGGRNYWHAPQKPSGPWVLGFRGPHIENPPSERSVSFYKVFSGTALFISENDSLSFDDLVSFWRERETSWCHVASELCGTFWVSAIIRGLPTFEKKTTKKNPDPHSFAQQIFPPSPSHQSCSDEWFFLSQEYFS